MHTLCCNVHLCKRSCLQEKGPKRTVRPSTTECNQPLVSIPVKAGRLTDAMTTAMSSLTHTRERTMCSYQCSKLQRVEIVKASTVILLIPHFSTHVSYVFPYFETLGDFRQSDFEARSQTALFDGEIHRGMKNHEIRVFEIQESSQQDDDPMSQIQKHSFEKLVLCTSSLRRRTSNHLKKLRWSVFQTVPWNRLQI